MFQRMCGIVALLVLCVVCVGTVDAGLVYNGDFELNAGYDSTPDGWFDDPTSGYSYGAYDGWNDGSVAHSGTWVLHAGGGWLEGGFYQDLATEVGKTYEFQAFTTGWAGVAGQ